MKPLVFAGRFYDWESSLVCFGDGNYNPVTGRWMQKDPIGFGGGDTNLYRYVNNDPVNRIDPSGLFNLPIDSGSFVLNSDQGVEMLISSYTNQASGNIEQAWTQAVYERNIGIATGQASALAEHYLYSRSDVQSGGLTSAVVQSILIPGYTTIKAIEQGTSIYMLSNPNASPASLREVQWGLKGVSDALQCR